MRSKTNLFQRLMSLVLCAAMVLAYVPALASAADAPQSFYHRVVDANTMDNWIKYFDPENLDTTNAGGVWTDKSVFKDASAFGGKISMLDEDKNFLTALSVLAANKEVVGYSTIPTDTVLVLDLSGSMANSNSEEDLIDAANDAIDQLLAVNENNRVGVVLYSASGSTGSSTYAESVTRILPIDRYTTGSDGVYLSLSGRGTVSVDNDVEGTVAGADLNNTKSFGGGTYIQAGLWEAMKMFEEMDTVIGSNNWQTDEDRMPILVLMSDGAPSTGTSYYDDVENSRYTTGNGRNQRTVYESNVGNGSENNLVAGNAFLTQLTAAYVMSRIEEHYQQENADVRGLFYTLGFNIGSNSVARSVMDPDSSTLTDSLWTAYNNLTTGSLAVRVKNRDVSGDHSDVTITKNSYATSKSYVDAYFSASGDGLATAFNAIVEEIIIQSRYYPTHLEGGSPDFAGYVEFTDILGEYMEVKAITGILLGDTLYDGHMMASKLTNSSEDGLGTPENPTELGDEFIYAVKARLGIASTADAQALVANAYAAGQLRYNSATDWSNYIGWYAKADGTYAGFWNENVTAAVPADAVYKIKSYGFLGETSGNIRGSDMMYMSVQVRTDIATGQQTMLWKIPASLVPTVTYEITLQGTNVDEATDVEISVKDPETISPIRLIFESGLRSDLNELNITRVTDEKHIASDGITRQFWSNYFDVSAASHDDHVTAIAEFTPSKENERFYFTFDSAVYKLVEGAYVLVAESEGANGALDTAGTYYHRRYVFREGFDTPVFIYEKMAAESIGAAEWDDEFVTRTGDVGAWVVPAGTPVRELQLYEEQKDNNVTNSAQMVFHPYRTEQNDMFYVDMNLGNNGLLEVTPAQGLKLSKTVDIYETGTSTDFRFLITVRNADGTAYTGALDSWITDLDEIPLGEATQITMSATGTYTVDLAAGQTFWLTGIPTGATYTVEEISTNEDYKIKSVHVNGISTGTAAAGTVAAYFIDEVDFVNTAVGEGDLVITKQVVNEYGILVDISDDVTFTAVVTLTDGSNNPVSGRFEASNAAGYIDVPANGQFTVTLHDGESFVMRNIPEETVYTVEETNIPDGFAFNEEESTMTGVVDSSGNDQALIVNTYAPEGTDGQNVTIDVTKLITGNREDWLSGESYTFEVRPLSVTRDAGEPIATFTIDANDADRKYTLPLSGEDYLRAGTYHYGITEVKGDRGGITYDTAERRFAVVVADADMDGDLEIIAVNNEWGTVVTKAGNTYTVAATFNNVYQPTGSDTVTIDVVKKMQGAYRLNGFQFALYSSPNLTNADEIARSTITDTAGNAHFILTYAPNRATMAGEVYTYYLAEINTGNPNITTYDSAIYEVKVTVKDNGDGTITATPVITPYSGGAMEGGKPTFTNVFTPSESAYVILTANKTISGDRVLNANEFAFVIEALTEGAPLPANTTVKNAAYGAVVFEAIEFTAEGTYKYKIYESDDDPIGGFTYDSKFYEVTVTVTDNGDAKLLASVTRVVKQNESDTGRQLAEAEIMTFENVYKATPVEVVLSGEKILTGKTLTDEFSFVIKPTGTTTLPEGYADTVTNQGATITFGMLTYDKAGVYTYIITEVGEDDDNYDYDESVYGITVTVTDNSRGVLSAEVEMTKNDIPATGIVFRNGFVPTPITYDIYGDFGGEKVLEGRDLQENEFEFALINAINGQQIGETVRNDADGVFKFPAVTIPEAGIYHYKITEVMGDEKGVSYDTSSFHIQLDVVQDDSGVLSIADKKLHKGTVTKEEVGGVLTEVTNYEDITENGEILFMNWYNPDPGDIQLGGVKHLEGRTLKEGEFTFNLYLGNKNNADEWVRGELVEQVTNNADGTFSFETREAVLGTTYVYFITEDATDPDETITYDTTEYMIEVTTEDNLDGTMTVYYAYTVDGEEVDGVSFSNTYTAPPEEPDKTGDEMNLELGFAAMLTSCACLVVLIVSQKRKSE